MVSRNVCTGGPSITPPALVHAFFIVLAQPGVQIGLQFGHGGVNLFPKGNPIELIEPRPVEPFDAPIGLRTLPFRAGRVDILDG